MNKYWKIKDFHRSRLLGVGSSEIPILAGLTKQWGSTPLTLYQDKKQLRERWTGNSRTEWGTKLEGLVLKEFISRRYGEDVGIEFLRNKMRGISCGAFKTNTEATHPERPHCLAHADLVFDGAENYSFNTETGFYEPVGTFDPFIVEAKTAGMMSGKRREGKIFYGYDPDDLTAQGIPDSVFLQVQWQMYVYDVNFAYVAVLIDTADYREYGPIYSDPRVQEKCLALVEKFWDCVQKSIPPAPETWDDVQILFPDRKDETTMISGDEEQRVINMVERDKALATKIKDFEEERDEIKNALGILIGENSVLASGSGHVFATTSDQSRESLSLADLKKLAPEIDEKVRKMNIVKKSNFRILRIK